MAKVMAVVDGSSATDALFRAWGSWISAGLAACGWIKTSDTGQVNWATVVKPGAANTVGGYELWRMNDSLQGTSPVVIKIEYGTGDNNGPSVWVQISTSSNGTGSLNGTQSSPRTKVSSSFVPANTGSWLICGDTNRFLLVIPINISPFGFCWLSIERTHSSTGVDTGDGVTWLSEIFGPVYVQYYFPLNGGASPGSLASPGVFPPTFGTGTDGVVTAVYPVFTDKGGPYCNPLVNVLGAFVGNFTANSVVSVALYGANRKYYVPATGFLGPFRRYSTTNQLSPLFRFE